MKPPPSFGSHHTILHHSMRPPFIASSFAILVSSFAADDGFTALFNGRDLTGWDGDPKL